MKKGINIIVVLLILVSFLFVSSCNKKGENQDELNEQIQLINDKVTKNESYFNEKITELTEKYDSNKTLLTKQNEELKAEIDVLSELLDTKVKTLDNKLKTEKDALQTEMLSYKVELEKQLTNFKSEYNNKLNELSTADEKNKTEIMLEISEIESNIELLNSKIDELEEDFEKLIDEVESIIENTDLVEIENIQNQIDSINLQIEENNQLISASKEELETSLANLKKEYADIISSIQTEIDEIGAQEQIILDRLDAIDNLLDLLLEKEYFVVTFNSNGGSSVESQLIQKYNKVVLPEQPTRNGYDFQGWYVGEEKWSFIGYSVTEDITLTAKWTNSTYFINYELNGGSFNCDIPLKYEYQTNVQIPNPVKVGHTFIGWTINDSTEMIVDFAISSTSNGDISLVANWQANTYKLTYITDGVYNSVNIVYGDEVSLMEVSKNGYTFIGWNYNGTLYSSKITYNFDYDISLYASWNINQYSISYNLDGGQFYDLNNVVYSYNIENEITLPTPRKYGYKFVGWFTNAYFNGNAVTSILKGEIGNKIFFAKWEEIFILDIDVNPTGFDGQGMNYVIKVLPVYDFDPFDAAYTGMNKALKQAGQKLVEDAYNIKIIYSAWDNEAPWGPERVKFIKTSFSDSSFQRKNIYAINITSQWIPTLVKANCLAELYNYILETGLFADYNYEQNSTVNETLGVRGKVYGFDLDTARPDTFIYYNQTKVASIGMADPAELWFQGEWTWSTFDQWVRDAQIKLAAGEYALDLGYAEFIIGAAPAQGTQMVNATRGTLNFTKGAVTSIIDKMKAYYKDGYWDKAHGVQDVSTNFKQGKTLLHSGSLWFLKESTRFTPAEGKGGIQFKIGMVPYPVADDAIINVHTAPYSYIDTSGNTVEVTEPIIGRNGEALKTKTGETIYGLDLSDSSYLVPYTGGANFSIMNYQGEGMNGITSSIAFGILRDLQIATSDKYINFELTADEIYRNYLNKKLDYPIDAEVVMSVQDSSLLYYELMETLSFTVGDGSHFGPNGFWPIMSGLMSSEDNPATKLGEVEEVYLEALRGLGY